jgi:UDP-N-acetylmuramate dehydrogenase
MENEITKKLQQVVNGKVLEDEQLSKHLVFRVGGPAKWFVEIKSVDELVGVLDIANNEKLNWFVIGGGSNAIASDQGFDGIIIKIGLMGVEINNNKITVGSGLPTVALARQASDAGLSGIEWMASLPGTIGGAIRGNAGCFGGETRDHLSAVVVLREGKIIRIKSEDLLFDYRHSSFKDKYFRDVIIEAEFELEQADPSVIKEKIAYILSKRAESQPLACGTAGCTFKNYKIDNEEEKQRLYGFADIPREMIDSGAISAGLLIDSLDLKGTKIGGARVSEVHANFIINDGTATADDIVQLISLVKTRVRDAYNIQLEEEIEYIGF